MVLAGGLNASGREAGTEAEGVLMLALTNGETARARELPVLATLTPAAPGEAATGPWRPTPAAGGGAAPKGSPRSSPPCGG